MKVVAANEQQRGDDTTGNSIGGQGKILSRWPEGADARRLVHWRPKVHDAIADTDAANCKQHLSPHQIASSRNWHGKDPNLWIKELYFIR